MLNSIESIKLDYFFPCGELNIDVYLLFGQLRFVCVYASTKESFYLPYTTRAWKAYFDWPSSSFDCTRGRVPSFSRIKVHTLTIYKVSILYFIIKTIVLEGLPRRVLNPSPSDYGRIVVVSCCERVLGWERTHVSFLLLYTVFRYHVLNACYVLLSCVFHVLS